MININILRYTLGLLFTVLVFSCSEDELDRFDDKKGGIYFAEQNQIGSMFQFKDTSFFSYVGIQGDEAVLPIRIAVMGLPSDVERPIVLKIDEAGTTAQAGVHYNFNTEDVKIAAGSTGVMLNITLLKDPSLIDGDIALRFVLEENELFTTEPKVSVIDPVNNTVVRLDTHTIVITVKAVKPIQWVSWENEYLGTFTTKKFLLGNELRRWDVEPWEGDLYSTDIRQWGYTLQGYLLQEAKAGNHIKEDELFTEDGLKSNMWVPGITEWAEGKPKMN